MSLEQAVFAAIHTSLTADATLTAAGILAQSVHRGSAGREARVLPWIEVDINDDSMDAVVSGSAAEISEVSIRVRIVADAQDGIGSGDTPEGAAPIDTIIDRVDALLQGFSSTITGFAYTTISRIRRYPASAGEAQISRVLDYHAVLGA